MDSAVSEKTTRSFPTLVKGAIVTMGYGERDGQNGSYRTFCVAVKDTDGVIEEARGSQLKTAIAAAGVKIGDEVRIARVGKRTSDVPGRSATNLYEVALTMAPSV